MQAEPEVETATVARNVGQPVGQPADFETGEELHHDTGRVEGPVIDFESLIRDSCMLDEQLAKNAQETALHSGGSNPNSSNNRNMGCGGGLQIPGGAGASHAP